MRAFLYAVSLLTSLPIKADWSREPAPGRVMAAYSWVGVLIGGLLAGGAAALQMVGWAKSLAWVAALLLLIGWVAITGALHLDGWGDCCDALFVPRSRVERLAILKDTHLGSFGAVGLFLLLAFKLVALQGWLSLAPKASAGSLLALLSIPVAARAWLVLIARLAPLARNDGMAAYFRQGLGWRHVIVALLPVLVVIAGLGPGQWPVLLFSALGSATVALLGWSRLGGLTGDVYGAMIEASEVAGLLGGLVVLST